MQTGMWLVFALLSSFFSGITAVIAKAGLKKTDPDCVTALRTMVVLVFAWGMVFLTGANTDLRAADRQSLLFLVLSGVATGVSWLCYFKALSIGNVNHVAAVDKSSMLLTVLSGALIFHEDIGNIIAVIGIALIALGMILMLPDGCGKGGRMVGKKWFVFALLSAVFAAATTLLGKAGMQGIDSTFGTAVRTCIVAVMAWIVVLAKGKSKAVRDVRLGSFGIIALSGLATGAAWLCYYRALQTGPISVIVPIDRMSIVFTVLFSAVFLKEKVSAKYAIGLVIHILGTLLLFFYDKY